MRALRIELYDSCVTYQDCTCTNSDKYIFRHKYVHKQIHTQTYTHMTKCVCIINNFSFKSILLFQTCIHDFTYSHIKFLVHLEQLYSPHFILLTIYSDFFTLIFINCSYYLFSVTCFITNPVFINVPTERWSFYT